MNLNELLFLESDRIDWFTLLDDHGTEITEGITNELEFNFETLDVNGRNALHTAVIKNDPDLIKVRTNMYTELCTTLYNPKQFDLRRLNVIYVISDDIIYLFMSWNSPGPFGLGMFKCRLGFIIERCSDGPGIKIWMDNLSLCLKKSNFTLHAA